MATRKDEGEGLHEEVLRKLQEGELTEEEADELRERGVGFGGEDRLPKGDRVYQREEDPETRR